jgi:hypothetical protein
MPVTKEVYSANAPWTAATLADMLRDAFIDAGLMTAWHDSFTINSSNIVRVLKAEHDGTKTYGSCFYAFHFSTSSTSVALRLHLASGWNPSGTPPVNVPTGTQYIDYERLPANYSTSNNYTGTPIGAGLSSAPSFSTTSNVFLDRYTSQDDSKQSWFVWRNGTEVGRPFTVLHEDTALHSWLNLDQGMISGFQTVTTWVSERAGFVSFRLQENLRRCLLTGTALRGVTNLLDGNSAAFHLCDSGCYTYSGYGSQNASLSSNLGTFSVSRTGSNIVLPVGRSSANPAFVTDYVPICTDLPWSPWTPTTLAEDFGIYMHYNDNTIGYGDRFIVQSALNEWQVLSFVNNANVNDGATATFVARII